MCYHCFDVLVHELKSQPVPQRSNVSASGGSARAAAAAPPPPLFAELLPDEAVECPLFVTWEKRGPKARHEDGNDGYVLRGCIGTLSPKRVLTGVGEYALLSALRDQRFDPVAGIELPRLRVAVSLLVQYEPCDHCRDWIVGLHGIIIRFHAADAAASPARRGGGPELSATFLPEVAEQQGWDQIKAVAQLIRKAGYAGTITDSLLQRIECTRYQSSKYIVTFEEYCKHLGNRGDSGDALKFITGNTTDGDDAASSNNNNCRTM